MWRAINILNMSSLIYNIPVTFVNQAEEIFWASTTSIYSRVRSQQDTKDITEGHYRGEDTKLHEGHYRGEIECTLFG